MKKFILLVCLFGLCYGLKAQVPPDKIESKDFIQKRLNSPGRVSRLQVSKRPKDSIELIKSIKDTLPSATIQRTLHDKSKSKAN